MTPGYTDMALVTRKCEVCDDKFLARNFDERKTCLACEKKAVKVLKALKEVGVS